MKKLDRISKKIITDNNENRMTLVPPDFSKSYRLSPTKIKN